MLENQRIKAFYFYKLATGCRHLNVCGAQVGMEPTTEVTLVTGLWLLQLAGVAAAAFCLEAWIWALKGESYVCNIWSGSFQMLMLLGGHLMLHIGNEDS